MSISVQVQRDQSGRDDAGLMTTFRPKPSQLFDAARVGNLDLLNQMATTQFDLNKTRTPSGETVLHVAAEFNQVECVKLILSLCPRLLYERWNNDQWDTPLHIAARWGHVEIVQLLLDAARMDDEQIISWLRTTNRNTYTALHEAVFYHHLHVVKILLKEDHDAGWDDSEIGESPLYLAAARGYEDVALLMMHVSSSDKLYQCNDSDGRNPLQAAAGFNLPGVTAQILERMPHLAWEKDKDKDEDGWTPLHWAACCDSSLSVAQLLSFDQSLAYEQTKHGTTPFHVAARMGSTSSIKEFYTKSPLFCSILDRNQRNALHHAAIGGNKETILAILQIPWFIKHLNDRDREGNTALHLLVSFGHSHLMPLLSDLSEINLFVVNEEGLRIHEIQQTRQLEDDNKRRLNPRSRIPFNDKDESRMRMLQIRETNLKILAMEVKEENRRQDSFQAKVSQSHLVVAALIATVTFAAGFTLPGGYNDGGKAILFKRTAFVVFIISNTIAFALSLLAVFMYFICATAQDMPDKENLSTEDNKIIEFLRDNRRYYEKLCRFGLYFTISLGLSTVSITILTISTSSLVACSFIFYKRFTLSSPKKNK